MGFSAESTKSTDCNSERFSETTMLGGSRVPKESPILKDCPTKYFRASLLYNHKLTLCKSGCGEIVEILAWYLDDFLYQPSPGTRCDRSHAGSRACRSA